jgi:hypothetical protein
MEFCEADWFEWEEAGINAMPAFMAILHVSLG